MPHFFHEIPQAEFQLLFENLPDCYLILTPQFKIAAVSNAYLKAVMVKREEILGRGIFEVFPDNPADPNASGEKNLRASLKRVLELKEADTMAVQKYDIRRPAEKGGGFEERYWSPLNLPVLNEKNEVIYLIHRVTDVTEYIRLKKSAHEQLKIAEELRVQTEKMETEIFERAQEIQEVNCRLRDVNSELESFSYSVSHDLRNPIQAISGFGSLLQDTTGLNPEQKEYLNEILKAAANMQQLIEDLINFSHSSRAEMKFEMINLSELVTELVKNFKKLDSIRKVNFVIKNEVKAYCDPRLMKIVFENLLQNAWKFTAKNPQAQIEFGTVDDENLLYYFRDNGVGFPQSKADKLFVPFSRLHSDSDFAGTGIGLAIVRRVIERHGGKVWAESEAGKGATFYLQF